jgi:hypothetical protein
MHGFQVRLEEEDNIGCVWLCGQLQPWLPEANFGLFGCLEVG